MAGLAAGACPSRHRTKRAGTPATIGKRRHVAASPRRRRRRWRPCPTVTPGSSTALTPMSAQAPTRTGSIRRSVWMIGTSAGWPVCCEPSTLAPGPQPTCVLDHEVAGVEIALRSDPRCASPMTQRPSKRPWMNACSPITTPSPISNVSGCRASAPRPMRTPWPKRLRERAPHGAPHAGVGVAVAVRVRRRPGRAARSRVVLAPQPLGQLQLVGRIGRHRLPAVHGRHHAAPEHSSGRSSGRRRRPARRHCSSAGHRRAICAVGQLGEHRQRQHLAAGALRHREVAGA